MITRIELKNFMSHAHTVIEPAAGLTVLVGPNNIGKSAVVAALQVLCHNAPSTYVTRHGEKECAVTVETDDGHSIEWKRRSAPSYVIDGQKFDRLRGGGCPDELHAALKMPEVAVSERESVDIHFGSQKSPIFLLDDSGACAARFFAASSDANRLVAMQARHKQKVTDAKQEKKRLEAESESNTRELEILAPVPAIQDRIDGLEAAHAEFQEEQRRLVANRELAAQLESQLQGVERHRARREVLIRLDEPPEYEPVTPLFELIDELTSQIRTCGRTSAEADALRPICAPPEQADAPGLRNTIAQLDRHSQLADRRRSEHVALQALAVPPEQGDAASLDRLVSQLIAAERDAGRCRAVRDSVATLVAPELPADSQPLTMLSRSLEAAEAAVRSARDHQREVEQVCDEALMQLREQLDGQVCPACGGLVDPDTFLSHVGGAEGGLHG